MAKQLKDVLAGVKASKRIKTVLGKDPGVDYRPKAKDEADWADKHEIERHEVVEFVLDMLDPRVSVPMCRDSELISADRSAGIFVQSGKTYSDALLRCTRNVLSPDKLFAIVSDPTLLRNDADCATIARCERDHESMAEDRAIAQVQHFKAQVTAGGTSR